MGQVPGAAGDLGSHVGRAGEDRACRGEERASSGRSITPGRSPFLPPGSNDRRWAQAAAEGVVLATMVTSIFPTASSPGFSPASAPALRTGGGRHFSPRCCMCLGLVCGYEEETG